MTFQTLPESDLATEAEPGAIDEQEPSTKNSEVPSGHKRNGKVARLSKAARQLVNHGIDEGLTYPEIIQSLGDEGKELKPSHLSEWRKGGYQDYLRHQEWQAELRLLRESASDLDELNNEHKFRETLLQLALTEIYRDLRDGHIKKDSPNYIRLFNALARLNREAFTIKKYRDLQAKEEKAEQQLAEKLDPDRDLSQKERAALFRAFEKGMGCKAADAPIGPDLNEYTAKHAHLSQGTANEKYNAMMASPLLLDRGEGQCEESLPIPSQSPLPLGQEGNHTTLRMDGIESRPAGIPSPTNSPGNEDQNSKPADSPLLLDRGEGQGEESSALQSKIENQKSKIELCHSCHAPLPPLLPNGERPHTNCQNCRAALRHPATLHFYCPSPKCGGRMYSIFQDDQRIADHCPHCSIKLPPWPPDQTQQAA